MKKMILVLAMILGLFVVGEARADGAWVLWWRTNVLSDFKWERIDAFTSCERCKQQQQTECRKMLLTINGVTTIDGCPNCVTQIHKNGTFSEFDFMCVPKSVDPRK